MQLKTRGSSPKYIPPETGFTLAESIVTVSMVGAIAVLGIPRAFQAYSAAKLNTSTNRLHMALERAIQMVDLKDRFPTGRCSISLNASGWGDASGSSDPPCLVNGEGDIDDGLGLGTPQLRHTFPASLTIQNSDSNQRASDGGMAVLSSSDSQLQRCLVLDPVLGMVRLGRYQGARNGALNLNDCVGDVSL